jgi:hypothetical protein
VSVDRCLSHRATDALHATSTGGLPPPREIGQGPNDLTSFDNVAERFAVGILADEAWVENVPGIARKGSHAAKWTNGSASFVVDAHAFTVGLLTGRRSTRNRR